MKRDMDLIRKLMMDFEEMPITGYSNGGGNLYDIGKEDFEIKMEHLRLLIETGYIEGEVHVDYRRLHRTIYQVLRITWKGHDFLDATRNAGVWEKTKERAKKAGAWTFDLLLEMAKDEVKRRLTSVIPS